MLDTGDGFKIAELDLELRGPGEFFGTRQAGMPSLRVANIVRDRELLEIAKKEAAALVADAQLEVRKTELAQSFGYLRSHWNRRYGLVEVG
jgi:ATP-dependent DNA helicase RecG